MVKRFEVAELDATYGALAHSARRDILATLGAGAVRVTDLAAPFAMSLAAVSKHVRVLEDARLIHRRVVGREHRLSINAAPLSEASVWLETYREFWEGRIDALETLLNQRNG